MFRDLLDEVRQQAWSLSDARLDRIKVRYHDLYLELIGAQGRKFPSRLITLLSSSKIKKLKGDLKLLKDDLHTIVGLQGL